MKRLIPLVLACSMLLSFCGGKDDESLAKKAGTKMGETLTDIATGMGKGIDKQMSVDVELSQAMLDIGISKTISKSMGLDSEGKGITLYLTTEKAITAQLVAKARNADDMEIGRSTVDIEMGDDDAQYIKFIFHDEMDTQLVEKYTIGIKE